MSRPRVGPFIHAHFGDGRTLPADAFANNATFVGENFDLKALMEDILQLDPETNHVVVMLGATSLERFWTAAFQEAFEPFTVRSVRPQPSCPPAAG